MQSESSTSSRMRQFCQRGHDTHVVGRRVDGWCRECARQKKRVWHAANLDKTKAYSAAYYAAHADDLKPKYRVKTREWVARYPDRKRAMDKAYAAKYPERKRAYNQAWKKRHPDAVSRLARVGKYRRRALLRSVERAPYDYQAVVFGATACGICLEAYLPGADRVLDHIIPISRGGGDTPQNVQSAHRVCNSRKGNRI
jgi:5-methylcytosine-specific restriction endonuclease McrA